MATIFAIPTSAPQDVATSELLDRLRDETIPQATQGTALADKVFIGGAVPVFEDLSDKVASRLPIFILTVIGLSVLLLIMAFRSLWIPLVSAALNLLSVLAAYGVVVAVFQMGIGAGLVGSDSDVPIVSFIPVMLFAILFGLSMDYNVFLLSRVHEAYNEGDGPRDSVIHGMARIGKVILFAGLIMSAVFLAFVTQPDVVGKMIGLGLGLAILIDVLFVRLVISPAVVTLLGDKAWWLPGWMDRILPNVSLEGHLVEALDKELTQEHDVVTRPTATPATAPQHARDHVDPRREPIRRRRARCHVSRSPESARSVRTSARRPASASGCCRRPRRAAPRGAATITGTSAWPATLVAVRIMSRIGSIASSRPTPSSGRPSVRERRA